MTLADLHPIFKPVFEANATAAALALYIVMLHVSYFSLQLKLSLMDQKGDARNLSVFGIGLVAALFTVIAFIALTVFHEHQWPVIIVFGMLVMLWSVITLAVATTRYKNHTAMLRLFDVNSKVPAVMKAIAIATSAVTLTLALLM